MLMYYKIVARARKFGTGNNSRHIYQKESKKIKYALSINFGPIINVSSLVNTFPI